MHMQWKTKVTERLGIRYPIMQGGMKDLGTPELAAAVSNAGGLGTLNALLYSDLGDFRDAITRIKSLTGNPFCVNISMLPHLSAGDRTKDYFETAIAAGVKIIETAGRNPEPYVPMLKKAGVILIHKVPSVKLAQKAEAVGADIVSIVGCEAGGHPGMDEVSTMILVNKASRMVSIPVMAGGGIVDGRSFLAALALGAEGVILGTRFMATTECILHKRFKEWIVSATENDTMLIQKSIRNMLRAMKNEAAYKTLELEKNGASLEELMPVISGKRGRAAQEAGNTDDGIFSAGQGIGLINGITSVAEVVEGIIAEASSTLERLNQLANHTEGSISATIP